MLKTCRRMGRYAGLGAAAMLALGMTMVQAQEPAKPAGATLTGHVICGDTNAPARFAKVMLKPATGAQSGNDIFSMLSAAGGAGGKARAGAAKKQEMTPEEQAEQKAQLAAASKLLAGMSDLLYSATVGADGTYTFTNVKPGTYYVHATVPGYVDPFASVSAEDLASTDPEVKKRVAATVTVVTIDSAATVRADLRLEHGASITGRVVYDDGTPAAGWTVRPVYAAPAGDNPYAALGVDAEDVDLAHLTQAAITDDTGRFHIAGLTPGEYVLQARLVTGVLGTDAENPMGTGMGAAGGMGAMGSIMGLRLTVYSGDALRRKDAKAVHLTAGEDHAGVEIAVPLHAMHSISGVVTAQSDGHAVNSGTVDLTAADAAGKPDNSVHLTATVHPDGSFRFDYVPGAGVYLLKAVRMRDMQATPAKAADKPDKADAEDNPFLQMAAGMQQNKPLHTYGPATVTVQMSDDDVSQVSLAVPEQAAAH